MSSLQRPLVAITMGDPAGIGPEVVVKALASMAAPKIDAVVVGEIAVLERAARALQSPVCLQAVTTSELSPERTPGVIAVLDLAGPGGNVYRFGELSAAAGRAAVTAVERAADLALAGRVGAIVTAPLNKAAMRLAGYTYDGHTELLAARTGASGVCMMLAGERLRVAHVSGHRSLREASECPSPERLGRVFELTKVALQRLGFRRPRIAVAGLNPHAGEDGLFGDDEARVIAPTVAAFGAQANDATISGPYPADTIFRRAAAGEFDVVIAMYHDQGHIPIKMIEFDSAVNITLGLPIIRTSPDHGTAFDIAGKNVADPANMIAAIRMAARMVDSAG